MTTPTQAQEAVVARFVAAWAGTLYAAVPYTLDNEEFKPPELAPWVRLTIRHSGGGQETLGKQGNRKFMRAASLLVQVFTPANTGTKAGTDMAKVVMDIYEGVSISGTTVRFGNVSLRQPGVDGKEFQTLVEAEFEYDETK